MSFLNENHLSHLFWAERNPAEFSRHHILMTNIHKSQKAEVIFKEGKKNKNFRVYTLPCSVLQEFKCSLYNAKLLAWCFAHFPPEGNDIHLGAVRCVGVEKTRTRLTLESSYPSSPGADGLTEQPVSTAGALFVLDRC